MFNVSFGKGKAFFSKETSMTPKGDTHEHENKIVFSYQKVCMHKKVRGLRVRGQGLFGVHGLEPPDVREF